MANQKSIAGTERVYHRSLAGRHSFFSPLCFLFPPLPLRPSLHLLLLHFFLLPLTMLLLRTSPPLSLHLTPNPTFTLFYHSPFLPISLPHLSTSPSTSLSIPLLHLPHPSPLTSLPPPSLLPHLSPLLMSLSPPPPSPLHLPHSFLSLTPPSPLHPSHFPYPSTSLTPPQVYQTTHMMLKKDLGVPPNHDERPQTYSVTECPLTASGNGCDS